MSAKQLEAIRNFAELDERLGTAGQPRAQQFETIAAAGFRHVINLAMPDHADSLADEGDLVTRHGMSYIHLPVPFDAPEPEHLRRFCRLLQPLRDDKVFVHCIMNYRVSAFLYHYLTKVEGWDDGRARSPIFARWEMQPEWRELMTWSESDIGL